MYMGKPLWSAERKREMLLPLELEGFETICRYDLRRRVPLWYDKRAG